MKESALKEKNAYLSIYISHDQVVADLAYSHYTIGRHYILNDKTYFSTTHDDIYELSFWREYFQNLEKRFKWDILVDKNDDPNMNIMRDFEDEGMGVSGLNLTFHSRLKDRVKIQSVLHTYLPTASIKILNKQYLDSFMPAVSSKFEYENMIFLNADPLDFEIFRYDIDPSDRRSNDPAGSVSAKIHWDKPEDLVRIIRDKRFIAFASTDINLQAVNQWANFITRPSSKTDNQQVKDILRAFLTVQLSSMKRSSTDLTKGFGEGRSSLIVLSGRIASLLEDNELVISILDGLELFGSFDVFIDRDERMINFGQKLASGINSTEYIMPKSMLMDKLWKVFVIEASNLRKQRKTLLYGDLSAKGERIDDFYLLSGEIAKLVIPKDRESTTLSVRLTKGSEVFGEKGPIAISNDPDKIRYEKLFFDGRAKPVVYGPDPASNRSKLKNWTNE